MKYRCDITAQNVPGDIYNMINKEHSGWKTLVTIYLNADLFPFPFSTKAKNKHTNEFPPPPPQQKKPKKNKQGGWGERDTHTQKETQTERERAMAHGKIHIILTVKVVCKVTPIAKLKQRKNPDQFKTRLRPYLLHLPPLALKHIIHSHHPVNVCDFTIILRNCTSLCSESQPVCVL